MYVTPIRIHKDYLYIGLASCMRSDELHLKRVLGQDNTIKSGEKYGTKNEEKKQKKGKSYAKLFLNCVFLFCFFYLFKLSCFHFLLVHSFQKSQGFISIPWIEFLRSVDSSSIVFFFFIKKII